MDRGDIAIDALPPNSIDSMGGVAAFHKKEAAEERKEGEARWRYKGREGIGGGGAMQIII